MTTIEKIWDGKTITEPGVYAGIPADVYHSAEICDGPSISSSGLRVIEQQSPAHYWVSSYHNPNRRPDKATRALNLGRAAHFLLLEDGVFDEHFAVRPDEFDSWRTKASKEWRATAEAAGKTVLEPDDIEMIRCMADSLSDHPMVQAGLLRGHVERSMIWKDGATGVWLKARPDVIPVDAGLHVDLKTAIDVTPHGLSRAYVNRAYHMQAALVMMGTAELYERVDDDFVLLFVEKNPPYVVVPCVLNRTDIEYGAWQVRRALTHFAKCMETGDWWARQTTEETLTLPGWYTDRLEWESENGLLTPHGLPHKKETGE